MDIPQDYCAVSPDGGPNERAQFENAWGTPLPDKVLLAYFIDCEAHEVLVTEGAKAMRIRRSIEIATPFPLGEGRMWTREEITDLAMEPAGSNKSGSAVVAEMNRRMQAYLGEDRTKFEIWVTGLIVFDMHAAYRSTTTDFYYPDGTMPMTGTMAYADIRGRPIIVSNSHMYESGETIQDVQSEAIHLVGHLASQNPLTGEDIRRKRWDTILWYSEVMAMFAISVVICGISILFIAIPGFRLAEQVEKKRKTDIFRKPPGRRFL